MSQIASAPLRFVETAGEAWALPADGLRHRVRAAARSAMLRIAARRGPAPDNFIRCLYGHAVFGDTVDRFRDFVRRVRDVGEFIDTPALLELMAAGKPPSGRFFHLSFDDGFANVYEQGGRVLEDLRVPYTMFVATDLIAADEATMARYFVDMYSYRAPIRAMNWDQVVAAAASPMAEIGCHTQSHPKLSAISADPARLRAEIAGAKALIEAKTGKTCRSFAWPFGTMDDIDDASLAAIRDAGFDCSFSASRGRVEPGITDPFLIPRHQVEFHWPLHELIAWANGYREA